jgi:hypothetical protein
MSTTPKKAKCTPEQRAAISRANGARSRGPTSPAGLDASRRARFVHGCRAQVVNPESERPGALAEKKQEWRDYCKPHSVVTRACVDAAAYAEFLCERAETFLEATMASQERDVLAAWETTPQQFVRRETARLATDPAAAVLALRQNGHGCRQLLNLWTYLQNIITDRGYWPEEARALCLRLLSADPACPGAAGEDPYITALYSLAVAPVPDQAQIARLAAPERRPASLKHADFPAAIPGPDACRHWLRSMVASKLKSVALLEDALRTGKDAAERAHVIDRAQLPADGAASRQFCRYHGQAFSKLLRCVDRLPGMLERDALGFFDELAAMYHDAEPATPEGPTDGGPEGCVTDGADLAAAEKGAGRSRDDCADEPSEVVKKTAEPIVDQPLVSRVPDDVDPSVRNPAEPRAAAASAPPTALSGSPMPVACETTTEDIPVVDRTEDEVEPHAPERVVLERLPQKREAISGTGGVNREPTAGPPEGGRDPPQG